MNKLAADDIAFLKLILRSPDIGNGWRQVSNTLWLVVEEFKHQELIELWHGFKRVRLSGRGLIVVDYI